MFAIAGGMLRMLFLGAACTIQSPMLEFGGSFPHGFFGREFMDNFAFIIHPLDPKRDMKRKFPSKRQRQKHKHA